MRVYAYFVPLWLILASSMLLRSPKVVDSVIVSPRPNDLFHGVVSVTGSPDAIGFSYAEVSFAFANDLTGIWYLVSTINQPVHRGTLATRDLATTTDGNNILRFRIYFTDGSFKEIIVPGLRVQNYTPMETPTPVYPILEKTFLPTGKQSATPFPTPTGLPLNPAALSPTDVSTSMLFGGLAAVFTFMIVGIYLRLRRK